MPRRSILSRSPLKLLAAPATVTLLMLLAGCGGSTDDGTQYEYEDDTPTASAAAVGAAASQPPITAREIIGHWTSSEYGDLYVQLNGGEMSMVYTHDGGRMIGSLRGPTFTGWWSEAPTRKPSDDAGEVQLTFARNGGKLTAQGWWRSGTDSGYETDWTMDKVDGLIPATVRTSFADRTQFVRHP